jgi:putative transposase
MPCVWDLEPGPWGARTSRVKAAVAVRATAEFPDAGCSVEHENGSLRDYLPKSDPARKVRSADRYGVPGMQRIWRREGLKVPAKQKPRGRLWWNDGSSIRLRPQHRNHVWSYDFVEARMHDGRSLRLLVMIDEFTRECLAIRVARRLNSAHVIELLGDCMLACGVPEHVRSDNGAEMTARRVKQWLASVGTKPLFIEPGSPWENGYCESFNGKLRDECLNGEIFYSLKEARVVIEQWRKSYNTVRPHSSLGYRVPAPVTWIAAA